MSTRHAQLPQDAQSAKLTIDKQTPTTVSKQNLLGTLDGKETSDRAGGQHNGHLSVSSGQRGRPFASSLTVLRRNDRYSAVAGIGEYNSGGRHPCVSPGLCFSVDPGRKPRSEETPISRYLGECRQKGSETLGEH